MQVNSGHVHQLGSSHVIMFSLYATVDLNTPRPVSAYLISKLHDVREFMFSSTYNSA